MAKRSEQEFPLKENIILSPLKKMWTDGWLDDFSDKHFLIQAIEGCITNFLGQTQVSLDNTNVYPTININNFIDTFLMNFSAKISALCHQFDENSIKKFVKNQLSAGKSNYSEEQFFRAISEITIISYFCSIHNWKSKTYEPKLNGKKNPEVRFVSQNNKTIDIEVKTPGFNQTNLGKRKLMPVLPLTENGINEIKKLCDDNNLIYISPRIKKLVDFINSAAEKFVIPESNDHINLLFINWSYSEFAPDAYTEAFSILYNPINGLINHPDIGVKFGITPDAYQKISAIIVYSDSLNGLAFLDLRYIWIKHKFRMIALNRQIDYLNTIGMNPHQSPQYIQSFISDLDLECNSQKITLLANNIIEKNLF